MEQRIIQSIIEITRSRDTDALEASLLATLADLLPVERISIINLLDELKFQKSERTLALTIHRDSPGENMRSWNDELYSEVLPSEVSSLINDGMTAVDENDGVLTVYLPVRDNGQPYCVIKLESRERSLLDAAGVLEGIASIYGNFLRVLEDSQRDKLTGLLNRRTFDKKLVRMMKLQRRVAEEYGEGDDRRTPQHSEFAWLAIVDIDNFKRVNDDHGHIYGDEVILTVGQRMRQFFRNTDLLFRFGGEEFLIVLEPMPVERAEMALNRFRDTVAEHVFQQIGGITVSVGFARLEENDYPPEVIDRADKALYFAKENGKNQVSNYEELLGAGQIKPRPAASGEIDLF